MDIQIGINHKSILSEDNLVNHVCTDDSTIEEYLVTYYSHGLSIANKYSDQTFNEQIMNSYLKDRLIKMSINNKLEFFYIDYYEQASIPLIRIEKIISGQFHTITEQQLNDVLEIDIFELVQKLNDRFKRRIASS